MCSHLVEIDSQDENDWLTMTMVKKGDHYFFNAVTFIRKSVVTEITNIEITNIFVIYALLGDYLYFAF